MKKSYYLLLFALFSSVVLHAQQWKENSPCSALCIDVKKTSIVGRMPKADSTTVNFNLPCGGGTLEDNPVWWKLRSTSDKITFSVKTSNCVAGKCGVGVQLFLFEGTTCTNIICLNGVVGTNGITTVNVKPSMQYYLQLDGLCGCQCDVEITYDKSQIVDESCNSTAIENAQIGDSQAKIYPNPVEDKFFIEINKAKNVVLNLYNTQGQLVLSHNEMKQIDENKYEALVSHLPKGIYLLKMKLDSRVGVRKIIVE